VSAILHKTVIHCVKSATIWSPHSRQAGRALTVRPGPLLPSVGPAPPRNRHTPAFAHYCPARQSRHRCIPRQTRAAGSGGRASHRGSRIKADPDHASDQRRPVLSFFGQDSCRSLLAGLRTIALLLQESARRRGRGTRRRFCRPVNESQAAGGILGLSHTCAEADDTKQEPIFANCHR
jgi:hypothetical protein